VSTVVILYQSHDVTVRDLVSHAANVQGAVHSGKPRDPKEEALSAMVARIQIGDYQAGVRSLQVIGRVVLKGLDPLRARIESDTSAD
jgi:hypothetical protein